jgi:type I restriction enzyme S subunit
MSDLMQKLDVSKMRRFRPYLAYKSSGVEWLGDVPEHWDVKRLKTSARFWVSNVDKVPSEDETPVRLCNYTDVYYNEFLRPDMGLMETTATKEEIEYFGLRVGDVLITKDSEEWSDIAVPALVVATAPDFVCGYHLAMIRSDARKIVGGFLLRAFQSGAVNQQFQVGATGVTRYGLPKSAIGEAVLPLPPTGEQAAIAAFLQCETAKIATLVKKKRALIERLKEKRSALISRTVTRGLPPDAARAAGLDHRPPLKHSGVEWLGEVPARWSTSRIKYVARIESGHTPARSVDEYWIDCSIPWVSLNDSGYLREHDYISDTFYQINELGLANSSARLLPTGAVVFSRDATVGLCAITTRPMAVSQHFVAYLCGPKLVPKYLLFTLKAMNQHLQRLSLGATIQTIGMTDVRSLACAIPTIAEQKEIVAFLDREIEKIDRLTNKVEEVIDRLYEYRTAVITAAVTGKIDVQGPFAPDTLEVEEMTAS